MDVFHYRNATNSMEFQQFSTIYPFFSSFFVCQVCDWPLGASGLLFDRSWMVVNGHGVCLSQKREPRLCQILPRVELPLGQLSLSAPGQGVHWGRTPTRNV